MVNRMVPHVRSPDIFVVLVFGCGLESMEKSVSFDSMFKDITSKKTAHLSELRNDECVSGVNVSIPLASVDEVSFTFALVDSLFMCILFQNESGHSLGTIVIEYEWKPPRCDTSNVHGEASTSQPKKTVHINTQSAAKKVSLKSDDINIISFKYSFDVLKDQEDMFETDKSAWQKSNNIESIVNDSDSEKVKNVFVEDNGKPMDELVDDARKKVEAPPKKTPRKTGIWSGR
ncbi:hypothetical protein Tco_0922629 [Tanacetum coccineum]|uniref:Uncharacterized protein n=1 Tax=Tanacetum coccineum TaxID=301880 RepID=A0ABQ5CYM8_9ASTR